MIKEKNMADNATNNTTTSTSGETTRNRVLTADEILAKLSKSKLKKRPKKRVRISNEEDFTRKPVDKPLDPPTDAEVVKEFAFITDGIITDDQMEILKDILLRLSSAEYKVRMNVYDDNYHWIG